MKIKTNSRSILDNNGFTLVEISIVIVIIGLIIGSILVGRDLIRASVIRSQISQIEQFNTAVNTFKIKYGYLPGDIKNADAISYGFQNSAYRDANGIITGTDPYTPQYQSGGETNLFWVDLGKSGLINGNFIYNTDPNVNATGDNIAKYLPRAKIGPDKYIYVWSGGPNVYSCGGCFGSTNNDGKNYFALTAVPIFQSYNIGGGFTGISGTVNTIAVIDAYNIDLKMDDGLPNSGSVFAYFANPGGYANPFTTVATPASATSCYDNGNVGGATQKYSISQNNGSGTNCAINFRFN
jgi:prepilin-type N-terminal cleavage/methylation domain-containing protein